MYLLTQSQNHKAKIKNKSRKITGSQEKMWKAPKLTKTINLKRAFAT